MTKKKIGLFAVAVAMILTVAISGSLAFLTDTSETVSNTFVSAGSSLIEDPLDTPPEDPYTDNGFFILENEVTKLDDGSYEIGEEAVLALGNNYSVLPGLVLPKNPFARINGKTDIPAYMYIEVIDTITDVGLTYDISDDWVLLEGITGPNGGSVYSYGEDKLITEDVTDVAIIDGDKITVPEDPEFPTEGDDPELTFYGYLGQASAGTDAASAFTNCFLGD